MKKCNKCFKYKDENDFYKLKHVCKKCYSDKSKVKSHLETKKETFNIIKAYCAENNGKCLEKEYLGGGKRHKVICEKNHEFYLYLSAISNKTWCPECNKILRLNKTFDKIKEFCISKGGICLDTEYVPKKKTKVKCNQNHIFYINWKHSAYIGTWCAICSNVKKDEVDEMKLINEKCKERGGECLEQIYKGCNHKYKVNCGKGHIFMMHWQTTKSNNCWCPCCSGRIVEDEKVAMEEIHSFCRSKNGICLENEFKGIEKKYKCKCKNNHIFNMHWGNSKREGSWCLDCIKITIQKIKDYLFKFYPEAKLVSTEYKNNSTKLDLICEEGHNFKKPWKHLKRGQWCPTCAGSRGEELVRKIFEDKFKKPFPNMKPKWLINPKTNYSLQLDGFCEELNLAFEYQGIQHYKYPNHCHKNKKEFEKQIYRDKIKKDLCKENNVKLIEIREIDDLSYENVNLIVNSSLEEKI